MRQQTELAAEKAAREARSTAEGQQAAAAAAAAAAARASETEPRRDRDEAGPSSLARERSRGGGEASDDEGITEEDLFGPDDGDADPFGPRSMDTSGVHSEDLDSVHFHVLGDDHRGSPAAARTLAVALAKLSLGKYNMIRARLLPRQQVAMDLSRDQGLTMLEKM